MLIRGRFTVWRGEAGIRLEPVAGDAPTGAAFGPGVIPMEAFDPGLVQDLVDGAEVTLVLFRQAALIQQLFAYLLGARVVPKGEGPGVVIGRAEMLDGEPSYLVRYTDQDGNPADGWWGEGALSPEEAPAGAADNAPAAP